MLQRFLALYSADAHDQPHGVIDHFLALVLAVGASLTKRSNGGHYQGGVFFLKVLVANTQVSQIARAIGLYDHIHVGH